MELKLININFEQTYHPLLYDAYISLHFADCNVAEPVINKKLSASASDVAVLKVFVGDRPTWKNSSHPWRVDPRFKLRGVPTLLRWENEAITGRLEDDEAHIESKIDALLAAN